MCTIEIVQDFWIKLGIKPLMHLVEMGIFSLNNDLVSLIPKYELLCQNSELQSHFSVSKIGRIFPKRICEEYLIRRLTYIDDFFFLNSTVYSMIYSFCQKLIDKQSKIWLRPLHYYNPVLNINLFGLSNKILKPKMMPWLSQKNWCWAFSTTSIILPVSSVLTFLFSPTADWKSIIKRINWVLPRFDTNLGPKTFMNRYFIDTERKHLFIITYSKVSIKQASLLNSSYYC